MDENGENWDPIDQDGHNQTVYLSHAEMKAMDSNEVPFEDGPDDGCWNCKLYNGDYCTKLWNNLDECYKDTERDERRPDESCEDWEHDPDAVWEDFFEED